MLRPLAAAACLLSLVACADATRDLADPVMPLGDFRLGFAKATAPNLSKLLVSRDATQEEWIAAVESALTERFGRFDGSRIYHFGVSVEAYSLPPPIVPGKSAMAMRVTVWDDARQAKLNPETEVIQVIKVFESRLAITREEQIEILAETAARSVETWLREQQETEGWFEGTPEAGSDAGPQGAGSGETDVPTGPALAPAPQVPQGSDRA